MYKPAQFYRDTSVIPFAKMITGQQSLGKMLIEVPPSAYAAGFVAFGMIFLWP